MLREMDVPSAHACDSGMLIAVLSQGWSAVPRSEHTSCVLEVVVAAWLLADDGTMLHQTAAELLEGLWAYSARHIHTYEAMGCPCL